MVGGEPARAWARRRRRRRRQPSLALAAALFAAAVTSAHAFFWTDGDHRRAAAISSLEQHDEHAASLAITAAEEAAAAASGGTRSLLQHAADPTTTTADEDALAAAVAAAAAAIDPGVSEAQAARASSAAADAAAAAAANAAAAEAAARAAALLAEQQQQQAAPGAVPDTVTFADADDPLTADPLAASASSSTASGGTLEQWEQQIEAAAAPPEDDDGGDEADLSDGPALRPVPGAASFCSPQVVDGGARLRAAAGAGAGAAGAAGAAGTAAEGEDGSGSGASSPAPPPPRCRLFTKVCADHDQLVLYSPRHNPRHPSFRGLPPPLRLPGVRADYHTCDGAWGTAFDYPPPLVRPATPGEESGALASPAFSRCTVPVVLFPSNLYELGDFFRNTVATVRGLQIAGLMDRRMTLVVAALGMRLEPWHRFLLRPFSAYGATTLSHLSSRLPSETREDYAPDATHVRCFSQLLVCPTPRYWAAAAGSGEEGGGGRGLLAGGGSKSAAQPDKHQRRQQQQQQQAQQQQQYPPLWATGQDVLEHYRAELPPDGGIPIPGPGAPPEDPLYPHALRDPSKLRVIVAARRSRASRARLLNQEQVWSWCTKFAPPPGVGRGWNGTACALHEFGRDLRRDLALASRADVLIAVHGPDLYLGALAMPRRSSVIEIRPYGFNATSDARADGYFRAPLRSGEGDALFWWGVDVEDAAASKPGQRELEGRGDPAEWPRDRHVAMRLVPLQYVMERVALTRRDTDKYRGFRARRQHHVSDAAPPRVLREDE
jgi:hypothetical protein